MRNLKKILALVLALVMSMSLVSVASADFADASDIDHLEAAEVLNALGVVEGKGANKFDPNGLVKRAEMAKMITIITLGKVDVTAFMGTTTDLTDINGHWAEAYIKYCYSQGIIAGKGNGIFAPEAPVTTVEAAKMLLVALGYNASVQGYVANTQWAVNVTRDAQLSGFYEGLSVASDKQLTRDEAAQMMYNAVQAFIIEKRSSIDRETGKVTDNYIPGATNLLWETFKVSTDEGILSCLSTDYDVDTKEYAYTITSDDDGDGTPGETGEVDIYTTKTDFTGLYAQNVKVLYKNNTDGTQTVYGIYAKKSTVMATGIIANITAPGATDVRVKISGKWYNLDRTAQAGGVAFAEFLTGATLYNLDDKATYANLNGKENTAYNFALIDNTGDGRGDVVVVYPFDVVEVSYVGSKTFTAGTSYKFADVNTYEGVAKNDWVKVTAAANNPTNTVTFEKVEEITAKAEATKTEEGKIMFNGTWYQTAITSAKSPAQTATAGSNCKYVQVNGYLFNLEANSTLAGVEKYVVLTAASDSTAGVFNTISAQIMDYTGAKKVVEVKNIDGTASTTNPSWSTTKVGELFTFAIDSNGNYTLTTANVANKALVDFDYVNDVNASPKSAFTAATTKTQATVDGYYINDDAVVFVKKSATSYAVTTGAKLKETAQSDVTDILYVAADNSTTTGYGYAKLIYVDGSVGKVTNTYAYVTGEPVKYESGSNFYITIPVGNNGEVLTSVNLSKTSWSGSWMETAYNTLDAGDVIKYTVNADGKITAAPEYGMGVLTWGSDINTPSVGDEVDFTAAVVAMDGKDIRFYNDIMLTTTTSYDGTTAYDAILTKDTVYIYVDSSTKTLAEGGELQLATSEDVSGNVGYYANVKVVAKKGDSGATPATPNEVLLVVVDVNNNIKNVG